MPGQKKRSIRENTKHELNPAFDKLMSDFEHGRVKADKQDWYRPAYYGTSAQQKPIPRTRRNNGRGEVSSR